MNKNILSQTLTPEFLASQLAIFSINQIAKNLKCSPTTIQAYIKKYNLKKNTKITLTKEFLYEQYWNQNKTVQEIALMSGYNHKTIRKNITAFSIPIRTASEYNSLARKTFIEPTQEMLESPLSLALHSIYICEGWTSSYTDYLSFCNQDMALIKTFCLGLVKIYNYSSEINLIITYNFQCNQSKHFVNHYLLLIKGFTFKYKLSFLDDSSRKNPIIVVRAGGKRLSELFLNNMNTIING
jgi:AraC-like DNA-binding protein